MSLVRQGLSYGVIGLGALLVDWVSFVALSMAGVATVPANLAGRVCGALLSFWANGSLTFSDDAGARLGRHRFLRFAATWVATSLLSTGAMLAIDRGASLQWAWIAKPVVDALLAGLAFLASRYWIYR